MADLVNVDNFVRAETARMFDDVLAMSGGVNEWLHFRAPTPVDNQPVIRMNRDTLYSSAIVDISAGATLSLPDAGGRYMSMMVINEDHFINEVFSGAGSYELSQAEHGTPFVCAIARTFIDPDDPADVANVNRLQDAVTISTGSARPYQHPDYDAESLDATRSALLELAAGVPDTDRTFGSPSHVDPVRHLIGTASGWGGLPESEAYYYIETEPYEAGRYTLTLKDVPVDAFWSVSIYNRNGYLEPNPYNSFSLNSVTADASDDGAVTLNLAPEPQGLSNHLYVMDGWNYALRLYRPHGSVINKTWTPPTPQPAT